MKQQHNLYTIQDHATWSVLFNRQVDHIRDKASSAFLEGLERINFNAKNVPNFDLLNVHLKKMTGWQIQAVEGIVPYEDFFRCFANKLFPSTTWIRKPEQLDYIEEPDIFHDVFGHVPLLTHQPFCDFLERLGVLAIEHLDNDASMDIISRFYWFTVEFGLIKESDQHKIYGAGILSSIGETSFSLFSGEPSRAAFSVEEVIRTSYLKDEFQKKYFVISSYDELYDSIPDVETFIKENYVTPC